MPQRNTLRLLDAIGPPKFLTRRGQGITSFVSVANFVFEDGCDAGEECMKAIQDLDVEKIVTGPSQSRVRHIEEDIDDLAASIEKIGLLEPVVVYQRPDLTYELLTGQRRFLAVQKLGWAKIPAVVLDKPKHDAEAKAISLTENFVRKPLVTQDLVEACTQLYKFYGSLKAVAEETGLPYNKVREYVKYDRVIPKLKQLVDDGKIDWSLALKAQDAATTSAGDVDDEKALKFANTLKTMTGAHRKALEKIAVSEPAKSADEIIEAARKPPQQETIRVTLLQGTAQSLQKLANDEKISREEAAADLIIAGLQDKGY